MTAFEPEALGNLVEGLDFHRFYFENCEQSLLSGVPVCCLLSFVSCWTAQQGDGQGLRGGSGASEEGRSSVDRGWYLPGFLSIHRWITSCSSCDWGWGESGVGPLKPRTNEKTP